MDEELIAGEELHAGDAVVYGKDGKIYRMRTANDKLNEIRLQLDGLMGLHDKMKGGNEKAWRTLNKIQEIVGN